MILLFFYVFIAIFICLYCILYNIVKVKIGPPPIGTLTVAYKYPLLRSQKNFKFLDGCVFSRRTHKLVKFCYYSRINEHVGFAEGVILSEDGKLPDGTSFREVQKAGLNIFCTPAISHAISIEFPIYFCFPLTKLFAVLIGYPKISSLAKVRNLCGYPILEIYSKDSVSLVVPLMRQDSFVVQEAEDVVYGKFYSQLFQTSRPDMFKLLLLKSYQSMLPQEYLKSSKSPKLHKRVMKG